MEVNEWYYNPYWKDDGILFFKLSSIDLSPSTSIYADYYSNLTLKRKFSTYDTNVKDQCEISYKTMCLFSEEDFGPSATNIFIHVSTTEVLNYLLDNKLPEFHVWA